MAVASFLKGRLSFLGIADLIEKVLDATVPAKVDGYETIVEADRLARQKAEAWLPRECRRIVF